MQNDILKVSLSEDEIAKITTRVGKEISKDYKDKSPMLIGLLKGCVPFMSDLLKKITCKCTIDFLKVSSYSGTSSTGVVTIKGDIPNVKGKDVILVDDILDTGRTLFEIRKLLLNAGAKSVRLCVLLDKPKGREVNIEADYVGGLVPNEFVVGYGLDYNEYYRNLPYIGVLKEEVYSKK